MPHTLKFYLNFLNSHRCSFSIFACV